MTTEDIRAELQQNIDEKYRAFHASLVPGIGTFLGVRVPKMREKMCIRDSVSIFHYSVSEQFRHRRKRWKQTEFRIFRAVWSGILYLSDRSGTADRIRTIE